MDILNTKIKNILTEKNLKVRPENIKKDVTILGITGTYEGEQPTGTIQITENGTVDVSNYASAEVNVSSGEDYNIKSEAITSSNIPLIYNLTEIKDYSVDISNLTSLSGLFQDMRGLLIAPALDTTNITDMSYMFNRCSVLVTVPVYDTSKVTNMNYMFYNCNDLSDESLNNIMQMCINATLYTGIKKLKSTLGLSSTLANRCTNLSNYQALVNAGWSIN